MKKIPEIGANAPVIMLIGNVLRSVIKRRVAHTGLKTNKI